MNSLFSIDNTNIDSLLTRTNELMKLKAKDNELLSVISEYLFAVDTHKYWMSNDIILAPLLLYVKHCYTNNCKSGMFLGDAFGRSYEIKCSLSLNTYSFDIKSESKI